MPPLLVLLLAGNQTLAVELPQHDARPRLQATSETKEAKTASSGD